MHIASLVPSGTTMLYVTCATVFLETHTFLCVHFSIIQHAFINLLFYVPQDEA